MAALRDDDMFDDSGEFGSIPPPPDDGSVHNARTAVTRLPDNFLAALRNADTRAAALANPIDFPREFARDEARGFSGHPTPVRGMPHVTDLMASESNPAPFPLATPSTPEAAPVYDLFANADSTAPYPVQPAQPTPSPVRGYTAHPSSPHPSSPLVASPVAPAGYASVSGFPSARLSSSPPSAPSFASAYSDENRGNRGSRVTFAPRGIVDLVEPELTEPTAASTPRWPIVVALVAIAALVFAIAAVVAARFL